MPTGSNSRLQIFSDSAQELPSRSLMEDQHLATKELQVSIIWVGIGKAVPQLLLPITVASSGQKT